MKHPLTRPLALAALLVPSLALAVGTRTFQLDSSERLSGGESQGVSIGADGVLRPGVALGALPVTDAGSLLSALELADGSVLLGSGPSGKVFKASGEQVSLFADTGAMAVTAMAVGPGNTVYAATIPDGKIFKISQGKAELLSTIKDASLWALVVTKQGLFAAGGAQKGTLYKVEPNGSFSVYLETDEPNLVSLAANDKGELYTGSSGKAVLYKVTGPGKAHVVADFPGQELKAIAFDAKGTLVIANDYPEPPEPPRRNASVGRNAATPTGNAARPKPGKGALFRVDDRGRSEKLMSHNDTHYLSLALDADGTPFVGTGVEGRVLSVDDGHAVTQVADTEERQVAALSLRGNNAYVVSSDPPVFHRVRRGATAEASWTSKVLDAQLPASFGTLSFRGTGNVEVSTRTGNTKSPDSTWSAWSAAARGPSKVQSPRGRYLQLRARFTGGNRDASLSELTVPFITDNARAVVTEVDVGSKGFFTKEPTATIPSTGNEAPKTNAKVKLTWKVENPDADALRYRIAFRREGQLTWRDVTRADESLTKTEYEWDTSVLSEGRYRVRVEASDELANPADRTERHALISESFVVDNTPPIIDSVSLTGGKLRVTAHDGASPIARIEVAVDGRPDFSQLGPSDGVFDTVSESGEAALASLAGTGRHLFFVRVFDAAGNSTTREIEGP